MAFQKKSILHVIRDAWDQSKTARRPQSCIVREGLKGIGKIMSEAGDLLDIVMPGNVRECEKLFKQSSRQIGVIEKNCKAKCKNVNK